MKPIFWIVFGPTSSAIMSEGIVSDDTILVLPLASKDFDTTTSTGSIISQFNFLLLFKIDFATDTESFSKRLFPTSKP